MNRSRKAINATSYIAGFFVIAAAMLLVIFLILSVIGLIHPRKEQITLYTEGMEKVYDGTTLQGSEPTITYGSLHDGHTLEIRNIPEYSQVGEYTNAPEFVILDETGADVTGQYDITCDFGSLIIEPRHLTLLSLDKTKVYDGELLTLDGVWISNGTLAPGHELVTDGGTTLVLPGEEKIEAVYRIISENGTDVTDQYAITEVFGYLQILPIEITVVTESAEKAYDGESLSASDWEMIGGRLLKGHTIDMDVTASLDDVGRIPNEGEARITDENGKDVTAIYHINYRFGTLAIDPIPLHITTMSAQKVYDGTPLACQEWELTKGTLEDGHSLKMQDHIVHDGVGSVDNAMRFLVTDENGRDITYRYSFIFSYGTLSIQPRAITIRTGSAEKIYDGQLLQCNTFEIVSGDILEDELIRIYCTSITDVGYSENYVLECSVYRVAEDGSLINVSAYYRITYEFGMLKITAD